MKITIVGGPFLPMPPAPCGAVERVWHGLAEEFARKGHKVTVLCRAHPSQASREEVNGVRYVRRMQWRRTRWIGWSLLKDMAYSARLLGALPRADVTVTNTFWLPAFASLVRRDCGRIAVNVQRAPKGQLGLYRRVARLHTVSCATRDEIVRQKPALAEKVRVIGNPIFTQAFFPPEMPRAPAADPTVLYTGRIHPEKGLDLLLDAFALLRGRSPRLKLCIVGPWKLDQGGGGPAYLQRLKQKAHGMPVEFTEPIFNVTALAEVYRSADYYCYPSLAEKGESFGVAPLEAMAAGLVPLVSDLDCFKDFIEDGQTGFIFNHRGTRAAEHLSEAFAKLTGDSDRTAAVRERGVRKAAQFSYARIADRYLADFEEMLCADRATVFA
jgi:glycosyltransferase involved in cell wall biosynthesis